jgi:hypothetical protein
MMIVMVLIVLFPLFVPDLVDRENGGLVVVMIVVVVVVDVVVVEAHSHWGRDMR